VAEIGAGETRQILVMNKLDVLTEDPGDPHSLAQRLLGEARAPGNSHAIAVSARTGKGVAELLALMDRELALDPVTYAHFRIPVSDGAVLHELHERGRVLSKEFCGDHCEVDAEVPESLRRELAAFLG
jgi:GTP-binding protein HflX